MSFTRTTFIIAIATIFFTLSESSQLRVHPYFAATCLAQSSNCKRFYAKYSGSCLQSTKYNEQPSSCIEFVCKWCTKYRVRNSKSPCSSKYVMKACENSVPGAPPRKQSPPPPQSKPMTKKPADGKCIWTGEGNKVVINLGAAPLSTGWDRISRNGYRGIVFMRSPSRGISPKGMYGKMCFNVKAPMSGKYYLSALSYAPHNTEHNDVWVESSKGFELWKNGGSNRNAPSGSWLKAYQNNGNKGMSENFKTIDFNGHRFLIPNVVAGQMFKICLSGRSKKYEMYQLVLIKCEGMYCNGGIMKGLFDMKPSKCM